MKADWKPENMILTVKFDTEKEAIGFYMMLNHAYVTDSLEELGLGNPTTARIVMTDIRDKYDQYWDAFDEKLTKKYSRR